MTIQNIYPTPKYEVWIDTPTGLRLAPLDTLSRVVCAKRRNTIGRFSVALPADVLDPTLIQADAMIEVWRGGSIWMAGLLRQIEYHEVAGSDQLILSGQDGNGLLNGRIIAYAADTAYAAKTDQADDLMKAIVRENLGSLATVAARDLTAYGVSVEPDFSLGPTLTKKFAWKTVLETLVSLADAARTAGTPVYFDMVPLVLSSSQIGFEFRTFANRRGNDRTYAGGAPTVFGREWGNLENPRLVYDYTGEASYVYAGGPAQGSQRQIEEAEDTARTGLSPWARRERFVDARNVREGTAATVTATIEARAQQALEEGLPRVVFSGQLKDTLESRFGIDWDFGDEVPINYRDKQMTGAVDSVTLTLDEDGLEQIDARVEVTL